MTLCDTGPFVAVVDAEIVTFTPTGAWGRSRSKWFPNLGQYHLHLLPVVAPPAAAYYGDRGAPGSSHPGDLLLQRAELCLDLEDFVIHLPRALLHLSAQAIAFQRF